MENLESRDLLAGITFDAGVIHVEGSANSDGARVTMVSPQEVSVELYGIAQQSFAASTVSGIIFIGHEGNDWFKNETSIQVEAHGNAGNDTLIGGHGDDTLRGGGGNDQLFGGAGDDFLYGHEGLDHVFGESGADWIWTGDQDDFADGGPGNDHLFGGFGRDHLRGGGQDDNLSGEGQGDYLFGDDGDDILLGADGSDFINAGAGNDTARGGSGDDTLLGYAGDDLLVGDDGQDWISGGSDSDKLMGSAGNDQLLGGEEDDEIWGGSGNDFLVGDSGSDLIGGESGDDSIFGGSGNDQLYGGEGDDRLNGQDGNDDLYGNQGNDFLNGNRGDDHLYGNEGMDLLRGHSGSDHLDGGSHDDDLAGGGDPDYLKGGLGNDDYINSSSDNVESDATDFSADGDFEIRGEVSAWNPVDQTFQLLGLTVSIASAQTQGNIQNGSQVKAEGNFSEGILHAYEVSIDNQTRVDNFEARGIVVNLNTQARTFEIFGILVDYSTAQLNTSLTEGVPVFIEGNLSSQVVLAREINSGKGQDPNSQINRNFELRGQITNLDLQSQTFQLLGVYVDFSSAFLQTQLSNGAFIKVDGDFNGNSLTAREVELEVDDNRDENIEAIGVISGLNANTMTFTLLGLTVDYSQADLDEGLSNGMVVEVEGWFQSFLIDAERVRSV